MGREWTVWEQIAGNHGATAIAVDLARLAGADIGDARVRAAEAPIWLAERIRLSYEARLLVGEAVSEAENARDQLAASPCCCRDGDHRPGRRACGFRTLS